MLLYLEGTWQRVMYFQGGALWKKSRGGLMKSITVIDRKSNVDHRSSPEEFIDLEIGNGEERARESPKEWGHEGSWPMDISHGHIKGGY
jgi:hypothetical protein